ncbi:MAG: phasin family protein [Bradyrhizobium sp.]
MFKVEDFHNYGRQQFESIVASANSLQGGLSAIANAYGDYTRKSYEDTRSFVERLSGVTSLDTALDVQSDYARTAYETFVAESRNIASLYADLAKQVFKPVEAVAAKFAPAQ